MGGSSKFVILYHFGGQNPYHSASHTATKQLCCTSTQYFTKQALFSFCNTATVKSSSKVEMERQTQTTVLGDLADCKARSPCSLELKKVFLSADSHTSPHLNS